MGTYSVWSLLFSAQMLRILAMPVNSFKSLTQIEEVLGKLTHADTNPREEEEAMKQRVAVTQVISEQGQNADGENNRAVN